MPRTETFGAATPTLDINEIVFRFDLFGSVFKSVQSKFNSRSLKQMGDGWQESPLYHAYLLRRLCIFAQQRPVAILLAIKLLTHTVLKSCISFPHMQKALHKCYRAL